MVFVTVLVFIYAVNKFLKDQRLVMVIRTDFDVQKIDMKNKLTNTFPQATSLLMLLTTAVNIFLIFQIKRLIRSVSQDGNLSDAWNDSDGAE